MHLSMHALHAHLLGQYCLHTTSKGVLILLHLFTVLACQHPLRGAALQPLASACHRYQINASQEAAVRDWAPAARHYLQAARVLPTTGNAYNQLAVLDTCALLCCMHMHLQMHYARSTVQSVS